MKAILAAKSRENFTRGTTSNRQVGRFALGWLDAHVPLDPQKHRGHGGDLAPPVGLSELAVEKRNGCKIAFGSFLFERTPPVSLPLPSKPTPFPAFDFAPVPNSKMSSGCL